MYRLTIWFDFSKPVTRLAVSVQDGLRVWNVTIMGACYPHPAPELFVRPDRMVRPTGARQVGPVRKVLMFVSGDICEGRCPVGNITREPQPGVPCKPDEPDVLASQLNRPSLSLCLFVSIGRWFATNRERLMYVTDRKYDQKLVKTGWGFGIPHECAPVECCMFVPLFAPDLFHCSSVLLCLYSYANMPSLCVSQELFDGVLSQPGVQGVGDLVVANVHFTVTGPVSSVKGDSVRAGSYLMVSDVTENWFPLTSGLCTLGKDQLTFCRRLGRCSYKLYCVV